MRSTLVNCAPVTASAAVMSSRTSSHSVASASRSTTSSWPTVRAADSSTQGRPLGVSELTSSTGFHPFLQSLQRGLDDDLLSLALHHAQHWDLDVYRQPVVDGGRIT